MQPVMLPNHKVGARLDAQARQEAGGVPVDSKVVIRPRSALGLKYVELDTGRSKQVFADGATMPAAPGLRPGRHRRGLQHVRRADPARFAGQPAGLRRRPRRPRRRPQPDHPGRAAALRPPRVGHGQPVRAAHRAALASSRSSGTPRASSRRSRRPTRTSSRRWPTPSTRSRATRRRSRHDLQEPADAARRHRIAAASSGRSSSTPLRCRATSTPRRPSCARALPTVNSALRVGTPVQRRSVTLNDNLQGALGALEDLVKAPTTRRLAARPHGHRRHAAAPAALPRPVRHGLQLLEHLLDLRRRAPVGARRHRRPPSARC